MVPSPSIESQFEAYLRTKDPEDLAPVIERLVPQLKRAARRAGLDEQGSEDVVQDTFLAVIEGEDRFQPGRAFVPWIRGIALRQIRAERRRRARLAMLFRRDEKEHSDSRRGTSGEEPRGTSLRSLELRAKIEEALCGLSERNQAVVRPALFHGLSRDEISARLGLTPSAVSVRLHRGLRQLRERLGSGP